MQWLRSERLVIRWNAILILLSMANNPENSAFVNRQLISQVELNNVFIKSLILQNIGIVKGITEETRQFIQDKCKDDANFVVRMICDEKANA